MRQAYVFVSFSSLGSGLGVCFLPGFQRARLLMVALPIRLVQ